MRALAVAFMLLLAHFAVASAQTAMPDSENGRYSFYPVADGVLRLDTRTGQISQCSRSDAGWACKVVPDERSALETEIARLQGENATLKKQLLARGLPVPGAPGPSIAQPADPELKLPSDADVDKVISFLEKVWRRLVEMGRSVTSEPGKGLYLASIIKFSLRLRGIEPVDLGIGEQLAVAERDVNPDVAVMSARLQQQPRSCRRS